MKKQTKVINKWIGGTLLAGMSLISLPALAQNAEGFDSGVSAPALEEQTTEQSNRLPIKVSAGVSEQFDTDIDGGGSFSITRFNVSVAVPIRLNEEFSLATSLRYGLASYNFDSTFAPWENINTLTAVSILSWRVDEAWTAYGGGFVKMSAETDANWGDGTTGGGLIGFNYKVDETLSLGAGLAVISMIEDDARVLPLISAKWKFADYWRLDVGLTDVGNIGYGAKLNWLFEDNLQFGLGAQYHSSRFRIDAADGVGQEQALTIFIDGTWHATPKIDLTAYVGIAAGGQIQLDDSSGNEIAESDYDPAPVIGLSASVKF